jgi:hypothetical protein
VHREGLRVGGEVAIEVGWLRVDMDLVLVMRVRSRLMVVEVAGVEVEAEVTIEEEERANEVTEEDEVVADISMARILPSHCRQLQPNQNFQLSLPLLASPRLIGNLKSR